MATDHIRYDVLARDALRGVLRRVLNDAATHGLPGEHHFFITFISEADGVKLSPRLLAQYPEEMTIVLQHQYWDLILGPDSFEVTVSFNKQQERIKVPFTALSAFVDPSVRFGLQFDRKDKALAADKAQTSDAGTAAAPTPLPAHEKRPPLAAPSGPESTPEAGDAATAAEAKPEDAASKIVKLDSFRKK